MDISRENRKTEKTDRISSLPKAVLTRIMSLLPTKYAVATSILSSKWKNLYLLSNTLDFDDSLLVNPEGNLITRKANSSFHYFVNHVLTRYQGSKVTKFRLKCGNHVMNCLITRWINVALFHYKVIELELSIPVPFVLQRNMSCPNLKMLRLLSCRIILEETTLIIFPCLKVLFCEDVIFPGDCINEILLGCPLLEELDLIECDWNRCNLHFSNPLLKKLTLDVGFTGDLEQLNGCSIYFNLPSLIYLKYNDSLPEQYEIQNLSSVVNAHLEVCYNEDEFENDPEYLRDTMLGLINGVSNSKYLYLSCQCLEALTGTVSESVDFVLPIFRDLTHLKLDQGYTVSWNDVLLNFLNSSPCLETLTLAQAGGRSDEDFSLGDDPVPCCVSVCLKVVNLENFTGLQEQTDLIVYFLSKANALEQMVIHWGRQRKAIMETEVLNLPKASETCSISFKHSSDST